MRVDRKLTRLPVRDRRQIVEWLLDDGLSCEVVQKRIAQEFNLKVGHTTVYRFYLDFCVPLRLQRAARATDSLTERAGVELTNWDASSIALVKQRYFELLAAPTANPKELALFATQIVNIERGQASREKLKLQRQQAAAMLRLKRRALAQSKWQFQTKAADLAMKYAREIKAIATNRALDADTKLEQVRERLFGRAPGKPSEG